LVGCFLLATICFNPFVPAENTEDRKLAANSATKTAASSRRLLFWLVFGVVVLNIILFLKFGLEQKPSRNSGNSPTNSALSLAPTNAEQKPTPVPQTAR
jgi:hypothetical protein